MLHEEENTNVGERKSKEWTTESGKEKTDINTYCLQVFDMLIVC